MYAKMKRMKMDGVCRCCLQPNASVGIFDRCESSGGVSYAEMLTACSSIPIIVTDGLPLFMCAACIQNLTAAYTFKINCKNAYDRLKNELAEWTDSIISIPKSQTSRHSLSNSASEDIVKSKRTHSKHSHTKNFKSKDFCLNSTKIHDRIKYTVYAYAKKYRLCAECGMKFKNKSKLKLHFKTCSHNNETSSEKKRSKSKYEYCDVMYNCSLCFKTFTSKRRMEKHLKKHCPLSSTSKYINPESNEKSQILECKSENLLQNSTTSTLDNKFNGLLNKFNSLQLETEQI